MNEVNNLQEIEAEIYRLAGKSPGYKSEMVEKVIGMYKGFVNKLHDDTGLNADLLYDLYIDSVLVVFEHIENGKFRRESKISTYLFRIFYFKVIDEVRKSSAEKVVYTDDLPEYPDPVHNAAHRLEGFETMKRIVKVLDSMCPECKELIMSWAYLGYDLDEIRQRMGFDTPARFSKFKFKCLKKFKDLWEMLPPED